jgi:undecaprenyl-diphosphatase
VLVAFGTLWPRARTILWIYALLIAASRVAVTAHYPSDVLAGALVGVAGAWLVRRWFALRGLAFSIAPDGAVRQKQGPSLRRIKAVARALLAQ